METIDDLKEWVKKLAVYLAICLTLAAIITVIVIIFSATCIPCWFD